MREAAQGAGPDADLTDEAKEFLIEKGSNLTTAPGRCAGRSSITSKIRSPKNCSAASSPARTRITVKVGEADAEGEKKLVFETTVKEPELEAAVAK